MRNATGSAEVRLRVRKAWRITFVALSFLVAFGVPGNALMLKRSLNELVGQAATIAAGSVTAISYEVVDGHALTNVTIAREAYPELGGATGPIEFSVPGGPVGDQIEWVSDTPTFKVGDRALVMLRQGSDGKLGVVGGIQGKFEVSETLLADISAIRAGSAPKSVPAPVSAATLDCCSYLNAGDGLPVRWTSSCPAINFKIYDNSGVTDAPTAIRNAATSWGAVACSCARLVYNGTASAGGNSVCSWASLADTNLLAYTRIDYSPTTPHTITAFEVQFNTYYPWSTSCAYNGMDVETVALHEFGHVLALVDQASGTCPTSVMCADQPLGQCKHDPTPDAACLAGLYVTAPAVATFAINNGAATTTSRDVTLNNTASCYPTQYIASESYSFSGTTYADYSTAPPFQLSVTPGLKTVYLKIKNAAGTSVVASDQITLLACGPTAPSSPNSTGVTASSIRWTWADNSSTETGFKVYADPGAGPPIALRSTTGAGATYWDYAGLAANTQHAFQVCATDGTCDSAKTTNITKYTLAAKPICATSGNGAISCNKGCGDPATWYPLGTNITFTAVNGFGTGAAKASYYRYVWNNTPGEPNWSGAPAWVSSTLTLTGNGSLWLHIQPCNGISGGAYNTDTAHFGPYMIDGTGPSAPGSLDDGAYQTGTTQLHASWASAVDSGSGVCEYKYAIGTSPTSFIVPWKSAGASLSATETGLSLSPGSTYYWYVMAKDCVGNWGSTANSDGIVIVTSAAMGVDAAKALPNGSLVALDSKTVTAVSDSGFYVQDSAPWAWAGIRVDCATKPVGLVVGSVVDVGGTLSTSADGEKLITGVAGLKTGPGTPCVLGLTNHSMSGASRNYDAGTGAGQQGVEGGVGLNNTGMLVRVWGRLTNQDPTAIRMWNFDTDPGFTLQGGWAYGIPTGGGAGTYKDPTAGYTGTKVVGYNLTGDYPNNLTSTYYATTPAVNCSGYKGVHLIFWRWLGVESSLYDHAYVDVSNDGTTWTNVWSNGGTIGDTAWVSQDIDISSVADGRATVYARWGMGTTDSSGAYPGWNIDDVRIWGTNAISTIEDGSTGGLRAAFPSGITAPASGTYVSVTGVCSCVKDTDGKVRPLLKVTGWKAQ